MINPCDKSIIKKIVRTEISIWICNCLFVCTITLFGS